MYDSFILVIDITNQILAVFKAEEKMTELLRP